MSYVNVPCGTCRACCRSPWFVKLMDWEKEFHGDVDVVPKKENGDCIYLEGDGCSLFGKSNRPYVCKTFDCRVKVKEWEARGRPELDEKLSPVIWAGIRLIGKKRDLDAA